MIKRILFMAVVAVAIAADLFLVGYGLANAGSADEMLGVVVARRNVALEVADQPGAAGTLSVERVLAPGPAWVVVHLDMDGKPGERVGLLHVDAGESRSLSVPLSEGAGEMGKVLVALHSDAGVRGTFEFDMDRFDASPDKPYFVDGEELATAVAVE